LLRRRTGNEHRPRGALGERLGGRLDLGQRFPGRVDGLDRPGAQLPVMVDEGVGLQESLVRKVLKVAYRVFDRALSLGDATKEFGERIGVHRKPIVYSARP